MQSNLLSLAIGVFLSLVALTPRVCSQQDTSSRSESIQGALEQFYRETDSDNQDWTVVWSAASGTPKAIFGRGLAVSGSIENEVQAKSVASAVLKSRSNILGCSQQDLILRTYAKVNYTHVLVYDQMFAGLRVIDGRADIRLNDKGILAMFGAEAFEVGEDFQTTPMISQQQAIDVALRPVGLPATDAAATLRIWASRRVSNCQPRLAWEVQVSSNSNPGLAYIDALNGQYIEFRGSRHALTGRNEGSTVGRKVHRTVNSKIKVSGRAAVIGTVLGWVADGFGPNGPLVNRPMSGVSVKVQGGGAAFTDIAGNFTIAHAGTAPVTVTVDFSSGEFLGSVTTGAGTPTLVTTTLTPGVAGTIQIYSATATEFEVAQTTAFRLTDLVSRFVRQPHILGPNPALNSLNSLTVAVNDTSAFGACNASYQPGQLTFAASTTSNGGCPNFSFATVVEHEWGHALDDVFGGIGNGDLAEGWADVITNFYTGQPIIGQDFNGPGQHIRDANNTAQYPSGPLHLGGLVWMGGSWKLRQALISSMGPAAGQAHAETIVIGSIVANASTIVDAVREVYILDDNDGNLNNGTPNCSDLFASYTMTHNIPSPVTTCSSNPGLVTSYGSGCAGTGTVPPVCLDQNATNTGNGLFANAPPGFLLAYGVVATQAMTVNGVELFTKGGSGNVQIYRSTSGNGPTGAAVATSVLVAGPTAAWYSASFPTPISIAANETFYIVHDAGSFDVSLLNSGNLSTSATYVDPGFGMFIPLAAVGVPDFAAWRIQCAGSGQPAVPVLSAIGVPTIGQTMQFTLGLAAASTGAVAIWGTSKTQYLGLTLPLDLGSLGAPGCNILAPWESQLPISVDAAGSASIPAAIPNLLSIVDQHYYIQIIVIDPAANSLGWATTNALDIEIGIP